MQILIINTESICHMYFIKEIKVKNEEPWDYLNDNVN